MEDLTEQVVDRAYTNLRGLVDDDKEGRKREHVWLKRIQVFSHADIKKILHHANPAAITELSLGFETYLLETVHHFGRNYGLAPVLKIVEAFTDGEWSNCPDLYRIGYSALEPASQITQKSLDAQLP